jgi:hypothetical protein
MKQKVDEIEEREAAMSVAAARLLKRHELEAAVLDVWIKRRRMRLEAARDRAHLPIERASAHERMKEGTRAVQPSAPGPPQTARYRAALVAARRSPAPPTFRKRAVPQRPPSVQQLPVRELTTEGLFAESPVSASTRRFSGSGWVIAGMSSGGSPPK